MKYYLLILLILIVIIQLAVIIIFQYHMPLLIPNVLKSLNSTKNKESLDVVIAHYKEDLSWVDVCLPENCRIFIYTKSNQKPNCKRKHHHKFLKNVGRDGHTYLYHIINNYDKNNSKNILFVVGSCDLIIKKVVLNMTLNNTGKYDFNHIFLSRNKYLIKLAEYCSLKYFKIFGYTSTHKNNRHNTNKLIKYKFNNLNEFTDYFNIKNNYISWMCGIFMIKSNLIKNNSKQYYIKLINHMKQGENLLNGHLLERSWHSILTKK